MSVDVASRDTVADIGAKLYDELLNAKIITPSAHPRPKRELQRLTVRDGQGRLFTLFFYVFFKEFTPRALSFQLVLFF